MRDLKDLALAVALGICLSGTLIGCADGGQETLTPLELEEIEAADQDYATAWLSNESEQVMETLTEDAVIVPSGMSALAGQDAIRGFWWPEDAPPTRVTEFMLDQHEVGGSGDVGFVRGSFVLEFEYDGEEFSGGGEYLSILRRVGGEPWKIAHRMWSDRPQDAEE